MIGVILCSDEIELNKVVDLSKTNLKKFNQCFEYKLDNGVYLAPSDYEACFILISHSDEELDKTICLAKTFFQEN
ncbi:hypothetical protein [Francisella tularensis]|uniref:hypothetical protein n=1 Tax=Francisella tularensis TaxID=263 RepID=UPI0016813754|nr:hypothetical protein [Francisella tularensis]MBD2809170.1 hypothetical protein [Francisella tularensis]